MRPALHLALVLAWPAALLQPAFASVTIDDFTSPGAPAGHYAALPDAGASYGGTLAGTMAGGSLTWSLLLRGDAGTQAGFALGPAGLDFNADAGVGQRIDLLYGAGGTMRLDFSGQDRLHFDFASAPQGLSLVVLLYYRGEVDNYSELGLNLAGSRQPFGVDFRFADFAKVVTDPARPADFSQVSDIWVIEQAGGVQSGGGESFHLNTISAVPELAAWTGLLAGLALLGGLHRRASRASQSGAVSAKATVDSTMAPVVSGTRVS